MSHLWLCWRHPLVKAFRIPVLVTLLTLGATLGWRGLPFTITVSILAAIEIVFSLDNALINAKILARMSRGWQLAFLTIGVVFAVGIVRMIFPILIVAVTTALGFGEVWHQATADPELYKVNLEAAHPAIIALAAPFLGLLFLKWLFNEEKTVHWIAPVERWLKRLGKQEAVANMIVIGAIIGVALAADDTKWLVFGLISWFTFQIIELFNQGYEKKVEREGDNSAKAESWTAGLKLFIRLLFIDSSFSFDSVSGAFAITVDFFIILIGLGIGALFVRAFTIVVAERQSLAKYVYLEHGAHWSIGALAVILPLGQAIHISEFATGLISVGIIMASVVSSVLYRRRHPEVIAAEAQQAPA